TSEMMSYTDTSSRQTLIDANTYTDNSVNNATSEMKSYTDASSHQTLIDANSYTDNTKSELTEYVNNSSQNVYEKSVNYTDARIQETGTYFTEQSTKYTDSRFADALNYTDRQIDSVNKRISNLDRKINKNRKQASAGIAGAMAMSAIPQKFSYEASFGMGIAHFDGEQAISAGGYYNLNNRAVVSLKTSLDTQNNLGIAAGLSYGW
ncbi:hypothetical protein DPK65_23345, partial [Salmonella enterica subsp. enterica]|nr:hypothetical protein [Salmonella enterica subsp. enterica]